MSQTGRRGTRRRFRGRLFTSRGPKGEGRKPAEEKVWVRKRRPAQQDGKKAQNGTSILFRKETTPGGEGQGEPSNAPIKPKKRKKKNKTPGGQFPSPNGFQRRKRDSINEGRPFRASGGASWLPEFAAFTSIIKSAKGGANSSLG